MLIRAYEECTGRTADEIRPSYNRDHYMDPEQSIAWGLVDSVIDSTVGVGLSRKKQSKEK